MKKRNNWIAALLLLALGAIPACNLIEECGTCELVTEDADGNIISQSTPLPFCGDDLKDKEDQLPVVLLEGTPDETTTYWNCY